MTFNPLFYPLLLITLVLICLLVHVGLPNDPPLVPKTPLEPKPRRRRRAKEPKPFAGLIHQPLCEACEQGTDTRPKAPGSPPPAITFTRGHKRTVDTQAHFCPAPDCSYYGRLGLGTLRANGHPGGQPGASCNVSLAADTSMKRPAPFFMANTLHLTLSCGSSHVWLKGWAYEAQRGSSASMPIPCFSGW